MTAVKPRPGNKVEVQAQVGGRTVAARAWLHRDEAHRTLSWGADNEDDYHGELKVTELDPVTCEISVVLHTERAEEAEVQRGLEETVAALTHTVAADPDVEPVRKGGAWT